MPKRMSNPIPAVVDAATGKPVNFFGLLGSIKTKKKAAASRQNGKLGGIAKGSKVRRPKKTKSRASAIELGVKLV